MKKTEKKYFYLGEILNVVTGLVIARDKKYDSVDASEEILDFITGEKLLTVERLRARKECLPYLFKQHPWLNSQKMQKSIIELEKELEPTFSEKDEDKQREKQRLILDNWCLRQVEKYGKTFEIEAIPYDEQNHPKDPLGEVIEEAKEIMGGNPNVAIIEY